MVVTELDAAVETGDVRAVTAGVRVAARAGVVGRGTTKSSGFTTIAAMLFCVEQPKFEYGSLVDVSAKSDDQSPHSLVTATLRM